MGAGNWDASAYSATRSYRKANNIDPFAYTATARRTGKVHEDLDPAGLNSLGQKTRECFDSDEHPNTTPVVVAFDVTGSMGQIPVQLQDKLTNLFGLLLRKGYCEDPQIMVGGIGDAYSDRVPLQLSQFEADNRVDSALENIFLEGNGGGQASESYELAFWTIANLVNLDSVNKRGKPGYLFVIGDEKAYPQVKPSQVADTSGLPIAEPVSLVDAINAAQEKFEVFFIYPTQGSYSYQQWWRDLFATTNQGLSERVLVVDEMENICEVIGSTIGLMEGAVDDLDDLNKDLDSIGASSAKGAVGRALAHLSGAGAVTSSAAPTDLGGPGAERL